MHDRTDHLKTRHRLLRLLILMGLALLILPRVEFSPSQNRNPELTTSRAACSISYSEWKTLVLHDVVSQIFAERTTLSLQDSKEVTRIAREQSEEQGVGVFRILGLIDAESNGNPRAVSPVGALGLMQIMPTTGRYIARSRGDTWEGPRSLFDVRRNITYGVWYYAHLLRRFRGDEHAAIAAYNWGPENILDRLHSGVNLPRVYPGKVYAAEARLRKEVYGRAKMDLRRRLGEYDCLCGYQRDSCGS